jgi:hypothetical protein
LHCSAFRNQIVKILISKARRVSEIFKNRANSGFLFAFNSSRFPLHIDRSLARGLTPFEKRGGELSSVLRRENTGDLPENKKVFEVRAQSRAKNVGVGQEEVKVGKCTLGVDCSSPSTQN